MTGAAAPQGESEALGLEEAADERRAARKAARLAAKEAAARKRARRAAELRAARRAEAVALKEAVASERAARKARAVAERMGAKRAAKEAAANGAPAKRAARGAGEAEAVTLKGAGPAAGPAEPDKQMSGELERVKSELAELRRSYYLSGAGKKLDLRDVDGFAQVARGVVAAGRTNMNYDRLYTLWQAVRSAPKRKPVVEVGAYRGGSARFISETLRASRRSPRFYVCDTFTGHARTDPAIDTVHHDAGKFANASAEETAEYLSGYPNLEILEGDIVETSKRLANESFSFVHVDVDVYPATDFCLRFFAPRLADAGLLVLDDYGFLTCPGARRAADDFIAEFPEFRLLHLLTGQAILSRAG